MSFHRPLVAVVAVVPIAFATSLVAQPKPQAPPSANQIAERVQKFYDKARTYQASFEQVYVLRAYQKTKKSAGRVAFEKPGKMSWRYTNGNRIVSDEKTVKVYEAGNKQMFEQPMGKSQYPAALAFLVGGGKLKKELTLRKLSSQKFPKGHVLVGIPKTPAPAYSKLLLFVDGGTHQVRRVLLLDAQGNRNRFEFTQPVLNRKIAASEFTFRPPAGTQVIR